MSGTDRSSDSRVTRSIPETWRLASRPVTRIVFPVVFAILTGWYVATRGISYVEIIVVSVALVGVLTFLGGERGVRFGFVLWIWTLGLGYRTLQVGPYLRIHPAEILIWSLLLLLIASRHILGGGSISFGLPRWLLFFIPFWLWAWVPGLLAGRPWPKMFGEFRNFVLFIPLFLVAINVLGARGRWFAVLLSFYGIGTAIATLGVAEYFLPGIGKLFPAFIGTPTSSQSAEGFVRATFAFWGHTSAVFTCALTIPLILVLWRWTRTWWLRIPLLAGLVAQIGAVFIAGYRSMWLLIAAQFLLWSSRRFGPILGLLVVLLTGTAVYSVVSGPTRDRVQSLVLTLEGRPQDSSGIKRWDRATGAWDLAVRRPWGNGWSGAEWVHSDFIQVAAMMGLLGGLVFLGAYCWSLKRLWRCMGTYSKDDERGELGFALLVSFISVGWLLATQPVVVLPQQVLPVWLVWVLVEVWLEENGVRETRAT